MKRGLIGAGVVLALLLAVGYTFQEKLVLTVMQRIAENRMAASAMDDLPDGLHVILCGAGSPLADERRSGPCTAVLAGDTLVIFDAGTGGSRQLTLMNLPHDRIEALFLTHFHSDHIDGMGELMLQRWVNGAHAEPLPVYGAPGVERVVAGFNRAYAQDFAYRTAHHGVEVAPPSGAGATAKVFLPLAPGEQGVVFAEGDDLKIYAFQVEHAPVHPAVGYKIVYKDRSVVISGDTKKSTPVAKAA